MGNELNELKLNGSTDLKQMKWIVVMIQMEWNAQNNIRMMNGMDKKMIGK